MNNLSCKELATQVDKIMVTQKGKYKGPILDGEIDLSKNEKYKEKLGVYINCPYFPI